MFEDDFSKMLRDYPEAVADTKVFAGLMKDLFPGQQMQDVYKRQVNMKALLGFCVFHHVL